jgi:hypothetical protein
MQFVTRRAAWAAVFALVLSSTLPAAAAVVTVPFGAEYTSGVTPAGPGPWLTATFDDHGSAGSVTLTLQGAFQSPSEFVTKVLFNLDPALDPSLLTFSAPAKAGAFADPVVAAGTNAFSAGGGSRFDVQLQFDNSPPANRFGGSEAVTYTIGGIPGLTAASFDFTSAGGGSGPLVASMHVQGIGVAADNSSWVTVPEPAASSLLVLGASILCRRTKK